MELASAAGRGLVDSLATHVKKSQEDLAWDHENVGTSSPHPLEDVLDSTDSVNSTQVQRCQQTSNDNSPYSSPVECRSVGTVTAEDRKPGNQMWVKLEQVIRNASQIVLRGLQEADDILTERMLLDEQDDTDTDMALLAQLSSPRSSQDMCKSKPILIQRSDWAEAEEARPKPAVRFAESAVLYQELGRDSMTSVDSQRWAGTSGMLHAMASKISDGDGDSNSTMGRSSDASLKFERIHVRTKLQETGSASSLSLSRCSREKRPDWVADWRSDITSPPSEPEDLEEDCQCSFHDVSWDALPVPECSTSHQLSAEAVHAIPAPELQPEQGEQRAFIEPAPQDQLARVGSPVAQPEGVVDGSISEPIQPAAVQQEIAKEDPVQTISDETNPKNSTENTGSQEKSNADTSVLRLRLALPEKPAAPSSSAGASGRRATDSIVQAAPRADRSSSPERAPPSPEPHSAHPPSTSAALSDTLADIFLSPVISGPPHSDMGHLGRASISVQTSTLDSEELPKHVTARERAIAMIQQVDSKLNAIFNNRTLSSADALPLPARVAAASPSPRASLSQSSRAAAGGGVRGAKPKHSKLPSGPRKRSSTTSPARPKTGHEPGGKQSKGSVEDKTGVGRRHTSRGSKLDRKSSNPPVASKGATKGKPSKVASRSASAARPPFGTVPERGETTSLQNTIRATPMEILFDPADMAIRTAVERIPMSSYFAAALDSARGSDTSDTQASEMHTEPTDDTSTAPAPSPRHSLTDTITSILQINVNSVAPAGGSRVSEDAFVSIYDIPSGTRSSLVNYDSVGQGFRSTDAGEEYGRKGLKSIPGKLNLNQHKHSSTAMQASDKNNLRVPERSTKRATESCARGTGAKGNAFTDGTKETKSSSSRIVHSRSRVSSSLPQSTLRHTQGINSLRASARAINSTQPQPHRNRNMEEKVCYGVASSAEINDLTAKPKTKFKSIPDRPLESAASAPLPVTQPELVSQLTVSAGSAKDTALQKNANKWDVQLDGAVAHAKHVLAAVTKVISIASNTIANAERTISSGVSIPLK